MGDVVEIREFLGSKPDHELEAALMASLEALPVALSQDDKAEICSYAKRLWSDVKQMESSSLREFIDEVGHFDEHTDHLHCLINPRTELINSLVAELIVCKIREIQYR